LSALTKIAVVLLVVASLLLSAGVVVFVNKVEDFKGTADAAKTQYEKELATSKGLGAELLAMRNQAALDAKDAIAKLDAARAESAAKDPKIADLNNQLAAAKQEKAGVDATVLTMTSVQKGLQDQLAGSGKQVTDLRTALDKANEERHSLNSQLTDALSKLEVVDRAFKNAQEKLAAKTASLDKLQREIDDRGIKLNEIAKRTYEGTPSLEGVVEGVFSAGGKPWASITIGSKDMVEKGMQFKVVNNNEFLGYLTIQTTEPNQAAGVLDGPKVEKVRAGDQVKTQLQ
jgi:predicted  nucleic acid-binding Zn-ribbon protein